MLSLAQPLEHKEATEVLVRALRLEHNLVPALDRTVAMEVPVRVLKQDHSLLTLVAVLMVALPLAATQTPVHNLLDNLSPAIVVIKQNTRKRVMVLVYGSAQMNLLMELLKRLKARLGFGRTEIND